MDYHYSTWKSVLRGKMKIKEVYLCSLGAGTKTQGGALGRIPASSAGDDVEGRRRSSKLRRRRKHEQQQRAKQRGVQTRERREREQRQAAACGVGCRRWKSVRRPEGGVAHKRWGAPWWWLGGAEKKEWEEKFFDFYLWFEFVIQAHYFCAFINRYLETKIEGGRWWMVVQIGEIRIGNKEGN